MLPPPNPKAAYGPPVLPADPPSCLHIRDIVHGGEGQGFAGGTPFPGADTGVWGWEATSSGGCLNSGFLQRDVVTGGLGGKKKAKQ